MGVEVQLEHDEQFDHGRFGPDSRGALSIAPDSVVVRRNAPLLGVVGLLAGAVAAAYVTRALSTQTVLDWAIAGVLATLALLHLRGAWDARSPLLVADAQGVRMRLGRSWTGLTWGAIDRLEHEPARGRLRDGRLVVVPHNLERTLEALDSGGRRHATWSTRLFGSPLAVPLGLATRASHTDEALSEALHDLAGLRAAVVTVLPQVHEEQEEQDEYEELPEDLVDLPEDLVDEADETAAEGGTRDPRPVLARWIGRLGTAGRNEADASDDEAEPDGAEPNEAELDGAEPDVIPSRDTSSARRSEITVALARTGSDDGADTDTASDSGDHELRPGPVSPVEQQAGWGSRVRAIARSGPDVEPIEIEEHLPEPAPDPVVGPELAAARTRLGLSVDDLAARTRIRAHVIEAIEVDDFEPCGGDFYARGHLRTLARVLGVDAARLIGDYDERYAHAPVNPRRVFEAELAGGGSLRSTRGGPNWTVLVAAVMALVLAWSVARLLMDAPVDLRPTPALNGSAGVNQPAAQRGPAVPVLLRAAGGGASVQVRDSSGKIVFTGDIAYGQTKSISVTAPLKVTSTDGSVEVVVDGTEKGALGKTGQAAEATYVVR